LRLHSHCSVHLLASRQCPVAVCHGFLCSLFAFRARGEQFQQHRVAFLFQFFYGAATGLLEDAIDDCLLDLGGKFGDRPEVFPLGRDRAGEVIREMLNAALTTSEVKQQIGSHYAPTQSRSQAHSSIGISDIQHTLLDEVHDLPIQRALDTVRDMADHFFSNMNGLLTDRCVKRECLLHGFC
jgi:hypothetical protein